MMSEKADQLRKQVLRLVADYHAEAFAPIQFVPGETPVPVSGRVFDATKLQYRTLRPRHHACAYRARIR
jgi:CDP-6-deoxy-D-xylo-4-hexulose-3-dehydrase